MTSHVGLVPTVTTTHTEPFHVATKIAALDWVSEGRAGWRVQVMRQSEEVAQFGRRPEPPAVGSDERRAAVRPLFDEAAEAVEVARRLWDSWEDDAEIRDRPTGRFIDRDRVHHIDFTGEHFSVRGPSITPRSPQGQPLVVVLAHQPDPFDLAARSADVVFVTPQDHDDIGRTLAEVRAAEVRTGRTGRPLLVHADLVVLLGPDVASASAAKDRLDELDGRPLRSDAAIVATDAPGLTDLLEQWQAAGLDGFRLRPAPPARRPRRHRRRGRADPARTAAAPRRLRRRIAAPAPRPLPTAQSLRRVRSRVVSARVPLSVLDLSPITSGSTAGEALHNSLDLARRIEAAGYRRHWVAEHHFTPGVASSAPALLIGQIAAITDRIRVGSAAVQTGHQTALSIVEQFGILDALFPGRIDLGLGRSGQRRAEAVADLETRTPRPPRPKRVAHVVDGLLIPKPFNPSALFGSPRFRHQAALQQQPGATSPAYGDQVAEVLALLDGSLATPDGDAVHAIPGEGADVEVWIFGSSAGESARVAGARGLPFTANYHVSPGTVLEAIDAYRSAFRPSDSLAEPYVAVSADVVVADREADARRLASPFGVWVRSVRTGQGAIPFPSPEEADRHRWTDEDRTLVADRVDTQFVGDPDGVVAGLEVLARATGADELVITCITHEHADRVRSHELLARAWYGVADRDGTVRRTSQAGHR